MQIVTTENALLTSTGDAAGAMAGVAALSLITVFVQLILLAAVYVWTAMALAAVFRKTDRPAGRAWVPVLNLWTLFELAGMKGWWAAVLVGGGILTTIVASVTGALFVQSAQNAAFGGGGDASAALLAATIVPLLLFLAFAAGAIILTARMMGPLTRGFGRGGGFIVLGTLLLPVWASIIGWGSARWQGVPRGGLPPTPFAAEAVAPESSTIPADTTSFAPPSSAPFAAPAPFPNVAPFSSPAAAPTPAPAPAPFPAPAPAASPVAAWSPPPVAPVAPVAPAAAPAAPAAPPAVAPAPAASAPAPEPEVDEHTMLAAHRRPSASLHLPTGQTVALSADAAVLGRNPVPPSDAPDAQPIAIDDATRTVSKTHALLRRTDEGWTITDLSSTNGVIVGDGDDEIAVGTPAPLTGRFLLGDAELTLDPGAR
ncbi:FHA domain-containing protein [Microbacterium oleivorans]|uniref:DUF5684 domain-containing protein n=1 Tax=Microbacterium oleivorans TaxID=273677 RepID=UPI0010A59A73|nr:DUF5684 domain-containing protein [Microbacterium oleivorans]THE07363.1 FHA domain-containing protein [Microbacterium oleivorans]